MELIWMELMGTELIGTKLVIELITELKARVKV